ncbi:MAG: DnaJ domain-containing protein [Proteobacteria bacterium]|nr:DnaJ domain-containing protein [Pseudomonadota bacterium]
MTVKTLYSVLGVPSSAFPDDIEDAFNRLKLQFPKDKLEADEDTRVRFLALQQAYETLSNPDARAVYDQKLAKAGVKIDRPFYETDGDGHGWISTRNIIVAGIILILISGMWVYHARQKAREEKETVERLLRMAEEEKRRQAELQERDEARRQAINEESQRRQAEARDHQFRNESLRVGRQASIEQQNAQRQAEYQRRQEQQLAEQKQRQEQQRLDQKLRQEQLARQQEEMQALRRLQDEKRQLRELCLKRYNRPDC